MSRKGCPDCGERLERNGVCPNCDEAAFIMDHQYEYLDKPSQEFIDESAKGHERARKRLEADK